MRQAIMQLINEANTALLVIDIQERFRSNIWQFPSLVSVSTKMLKAAKILEIPIIVTEQNPRALGATVNELNITGNPYVYSKMKFSSCIPEVKTLLEKSNIKSVVLFGIESHVCVLQTALELRTLDYDVHVLADAVSSINQFEIDIALNRMRQSGVHVTTSESIIFQFLRTAQRETFKEISTLVKEYKEATATNGLVVGNNRL